MPVIDDEISAYETMQQSLEANDTGKWVVFHERQLVGTYDSFESAAKDATRKFGRGPFLIRQVGAPPVALPTSIMYSL